MNLAYPNSKKSGEPFPKLLLPTGIFLALSGAGIVPAYATCSTAGTTVTCSGVANPLAPSYSNSANNLNVTVENLQSSNSAIQDTDMASEMVNFTKAQVLQQAGVSMLAQANSASQAVLKLLG